jgi:hypothetical protein
MFAVPLRQFERNEVYGTWAGATVWHLGAGFFGRWDIGPSVIQDMRVWNYWGDGFFGYPTNNLVLDHFVARSSTMSVAGSEFSDYLTANAVVRHADIQGASRGIIPPYKVGSVSDTGQQIIPFTVEDSYLRNHYNIYIGTMWANSGSADLTPRETRIRNVTFASLPMEQDPHQDIEMAYDLGNGNANAVQLDRVVVTDYNGQAGDNFQVYYKEQAADFIVPQTEDPDYPGDIVGSPDAGLTNQQNWDRYQLAIAGAVAPTNTTTRANIDGLVSPM